MNPEYIRQKTKKKKTGAMEIMIYEIIKLIMQSLEISEDLYPIIISCNSSQCKRHLNTVLPFMSYL